MEHEQPTFRYILENHSPHAIPVANQGGIPFLWATGGQAFLEGHRREKPTPPHSCHISDYPALSVKEAAWPPQDVENRVIEKWERLPAGKRIVWDNINLRTMYFQGMAVTNGLHAIQGHWLIGKNRWVSSQPIPVVVRSGVPWIQVYHHRPMPGHRTGAITVYKTIIDGRWFLFSHGRSRICELSGQWDLLEFKIDPANDQLIITVKGPGNPRSYYYHMNLGATSGRSWDGRQFYDCAPVPESIPSEMEPKSSGTSDNTADIESLVVAATLLALGTAAAWKFPQHRPRSY